MIVPKGMKPTGVRFHKNDPPILRRVSYSFISVLLTTQIMFKLDFLEMSLSFLRYQLTFADTQL